MISDPVSLADLARTEALNCARSLGEISPQSISISGGLAARGAHTSWVNRAEGLGFSGPVTAVDIDRLIQWFNESGLDAIIKTCPYAHPTLFECLSNAGFKIGHFEQVFFRALHEPVFPDHPLPPEIQLRLIDSCDTDEAHEIATAIVRGFSRPGLPIRDDDVAMTARCILRPRAFTFAAFCNDQCIGGGGMEFAGDLAQLYGVAILEPFRRKGLQQAIIAARLNFALQRGMKFAAIASSPGESTERNVLRLRFNVLYSKLVLKRSFQSASKST